MSEKIRYADLRITCFTTGWTRGPYEFVHLPTGYKVTADTKAEGLAKLEELLSRSVPHKAEEEE